MLPRNAVEVLRRCLKPARATQLVSHNSVLQISPPRRTAGRPRSGLVNVNVDIPCAHRYTEGLISISGRRISPDRRHLWLVALEMPRPGIVPELGSPDVEVLRLLRLSVPLKSKTRPEEVWKLEQHTACTNHLSSRWTPNGLVLLAETCSPRDSGRGCRRRKRRGGGRSRWQAVLALDALLLGRLREAPGSLSSAVAAHAGRGWVRLMLGVLADY